MDVNFKGRTALVTGAGSGIGRELVKRLVKLGAKVVAVSQTQAKLDSLKDEIGSDVETVCVNLANWTETQVMLSDACKKVDFLINNAGYCHDCPVDQVPEDEMDKTIDINLKAPINLIGLVTNGMKERKFGSIVNVSSVAGIAALDDHLSYAASKAALDMVTKVCAKELGPFNIRVNSVNPTVVWTQMGQAGWSDPKKKATMTSKIPLARFAEVKEVVDPIVYLLSDNSSMITGITLPVDGGFVAT